MRICLVSREFPGFHSGGIGTYVAEAAKAWARAGHEVHVLTEGDESLLAKGPKTSPGAIFHRVTLDTPNLAFDAYPTWHIRYVMAVGEHLATLHERHAFDYIEFPDYWGEGYFPLLAKRTRGAYAEALLAVRLHSPSRMAWELNRIYHVPGELQYLHHMEVTSMRMADALLSPSRSLLEITQKQLGPSEWGERIEAVLPYPLDPAPLDEVAAKAMEESARSQRPLPHDRGSIAHGHDLPEVLYYGRLEHRKGVVQLVRAAERLLERGVRARFRFIGGDTNSGPFGRSMREHLQRLVRPLPGDCFIFEHSRPRELLAAAIARANVCCFPSIWENFPNVCMEAMAQRAVVVGSRDGGMSQMIEHGRTGFLVPGGDVIALADALEQAISMSADQRRAMGESARASILKLCDPASVIAQTRELLAAARARVDRASAASQEAWNTVRAAPPRADAPLVSIIIPFYNLGAYLPATIASVDRQTFRDFELIIINDGSTEDASLDALQPLRSRDDVRIIDQPNRGLSNARNTGVDAARGRWILPLDADDILHERALERLVEARVRNPWASSSTCLARYFIDDPGEVRGGWIPFGLDRDVLTLRNCAGTPLCLLDRDFLARTRYDEWLTAYEDWDMYCSLAESGGRSVVVPELLFFYRVRPQSMLRVDGIPKHDQLRSYLANKHPRLAGDPTYSLRLLYGESMEQRLQIAWYQEETARLRARVADLEGKSVDTDLARPNGTLEDITRQRARALIEENIRYRIADRVNDLLKSVGLQKAVKRLVRGPGGTHERGG